MWWPAIGGLVIGIGGLFVPEALGVGYSTIGSLLAGTATWHVIFGILIVKTLIWSISLGSGTSGGVLAPLLMIGGALGAAEAHILPDYGVGFWPLIAMAATLAGTMRAPFTGVVFALELTGDMHSLPALLVAVMFAYGITVLIMKRSILTEKISRRGLHLSAEYSIDPLELGFVRDVMRLAPVTIRESDLARNDADAVPLHLGHGRQRLFPVLDDAGKLVGVLGRGDIEAHAPGSDRPPTGLLECIQRRVIVAYGNEPLRVAADRMAETGKTVLPVVSRTDRTELVGIISVNELLLGRKRTRTEERSRARSLMVPKVRRAATERVSQ
jgi:CBS domain-containing protein